MVTLYVIQDQIWLQSLLLCKFLTVFIIDTIGQLSGRAEWYGIWAVKSESHCSKIPMQYASWKAVKNFPGFSRSWKVLGNQFDPGKSWKLKLKVLESIGK